MRVGGGGAGANLKEVHPHRSVGSARMQDHRSHGVWPLGYQKTQDPRIWPRTRQREGDMTPVPAHPWGAIPASGADAHLCHVPMPGLRRVPLAAQSAASYSPPACGPARCSARASASQSCAPRGLPVTRMPPGAAVPRPLPRSPTRTGVSHGPNGATECLSPFLPSGLRHFPGPPQGGALVAPASRCTRSPFPRRCACVCVCVCVGEGGGVQCCGCECSAPLLARGGGGGMRARVAGQKGCQPSNEHPGPATGDSSGLLGPWYGRGRRAPHLPPLPHPRALCSGFSTHLTTLWDPDMPGQACA